MESDSVRDRNRGLLSNRRDTSHLVPLVEGSLVVVPLLGLLGLVGAYTRLVLHVFGRDFLGGLVVLDTQLRVRNLLLLCVRI